MKLINHPTLVCVQDSLKSLADLTGSELVTSVLHEEWGTCLIVYFDTFLGTGGNAIDDMPKECHIFFGHGKNATFLWAYVYSPHEYCRSIDEGLTDVQSEDESRRTVLDFQGVLNYLEGKKYDYIHRKDSVLT